MRSHRVLEAGTTTTVEARTSASATLRIKSITVLGTGNVTLTVTNSVDPETGGGYTAVFNSAVGRYKGPFEFRRADKLVFVVEASTTVLLEGYEANE